MAKSRAVVFEIETEHGIRREADRATGGIRAVLKAAEDCHP